MDRPPSLAGLPEILCRADLYSPTIRNAELSPELKAKLIIGDEQVKKLIDFDWDNVIKMQAQWTQRFNREIAG